jgi:hypothetical protein
MLQLGPNQSYVDRAPPIAGSPPKMYCDIAPLENQTLGFPPHDHLLTTTIETITFQEGGSIR